MITSYFSRVKDLLEEVERKETPVLETGATKLAGALANGNIIHLFGCGHSHELTEEVYYRAGGLVPIHPIFHEPLMLHEGAVRSSEFERKNDYAETFMKDEDIRPGDIMLVISTSGRNPVPVDVALLAQAKGAYTIALTSKAYSESQPSRHKDGLRLLDAADLVIDNHVPPGDALLEHERMDVKFAPGSTIVGAAIIHSMFSQGIAELADQGIDPPVLLSGNIDGADEHNQRLLKQYQDRIQL
ncbi:SIS domain-containing protein [Thalassobacillus sp. CUG 92003]|uniref:SIS domain-containing protein n=1 Tax=Thalassobacillus sp. CUG 92003 TaxID=2736641 RepID=UPI0015E67628|nr:SIS domain-containing protein [Thalassobacillus sp. CUG 92003]